MNTYKISVPRGTFNVRDRENKDGVPVVMIHGWPESSYCWEAVASFLNPDLRVIAPDLRGLGDSERTLGDVSVYQKVELAKDVIEVIDALNVKDFFLVGHDWGGIVAQEVALAIPDRVKKLALMNIPVIVNTRGYAEAMQKIYSRGAVPFWYQYFQQQPNLPEAMIQGNEDLWVRHFFGKSGKDIPIPLEAVDEYVRCYRIQNTPATAAAYYRAMRADQKRWAGLGGAKYPMPSLYIHGSLDPVIIAENLNHIEECFDSIQVKSISAGHFVQEEKPREVAALLNQFLKE
ncbi:MAG TPA: alpha/beta hydrolase [Smithellaceae bacterium]|nr:alpha/beta hydrolase [Smithellaceae bacterium]